MTTKTLLVIAALVAGFLVMAARAGAQTGDQTDARADATAWSAVHLDEFRQLAREVTLTATRAHAAAKRDVGAFPNRGGQFVGELNYLVARSRDLEVLSVGEVSPQQAGPIVDRLMKDAREVDRGMREAKVFGSVWGDTSGTITTLERMASLARSWPVRFERR